MKEAQELAFVVLTYSGSFMTLCLGVGMLSEIFNTRRRMEINREVDLAYAIKKEVIT